MTVICLMLFLTICTLSSCLSIRETTKKQLAEVTPVDAVVSYENLNTSSWHDLDDSNSENKAAKDRIKKLQEEEERNSKENIEEIVRADQNLWNKLKDQTTVNTYNLSDNYEERLWQKSILSESAIKKISELTKGHNDGDTIINIMSLSDYNKVAKLYHFDQVEMREDQYFILSDFSKIEEVYNLSLKEKHQIKIKDKTLTPRFDHNIRGFVEPTNPRANFGLLIVTDNLVKGMFKQENIFIANYKANSREEKEQTEKELRQVIIGNEKDYIRITADRFYSLRTKIFIVASSVGLQAIATFLGLYLGIIFLITSAAILALKELSESSDNREKYMVLRRLGADEKMIKRALFRQIAIFFAAPLFLATIHSIFGLAFAINILSYIGTDGLLPSIIMTASLLVIIYGGYFTITYFSSKRIISEKYLERR